MSIEFRSLADRIVNTKAEVESLRTQLAIKERELKSLVAELNSQVGIEAPPDKFKPRRRAIRAAIEALLLKHDAMTVAELAAALSVSAASVYPHLKKLRDEGKLTSLEDNHYGLTFAYVEELRAAGHSEGANQAQQ